MRGLARQLLAKGHKTEALPIKARQCGLFEHTLSYVHIQLILINTFSELLYTVLQDNGTTLAIRHSNFQSKTSRIRMIFLLPVVRGLNKGNQLKEGLIVFCPITVLPIPITLWHKGTNFSFILITLSNTCRPPNHLSYHAHCVASCCQSCIFLLLSLFLFHSLSLSLKLSLHKSLQYILHATPKVSLSQVSFTYRQPLNHYYIQHRHQVLVPQNTPSLIPWASSLNATRSSHHEQGGCGESHTRTSYSSSLYRNWEIFAL